MWLLIQNSLERTFVEPWPHPLAAKLYLPDLAEGGEDFLEVLPIHVPGQPPDVDLGGGRGAAPSPGLSSRLGPWAVARLLWSRLEVNIIITLNSKSESIHSSHLDTRLVILGLAFLSHWRGSWLFPSLGLFGTFLLLIFLWPVPASGSDKGCKVNILSLYIIVNVAPARIGTGITAGFWAWVTARAAGAGISSKTGGYKNNIRRKSVERNFSLFLAPSLPLLLLPLAPLWAGVAAIAALVLLLLLGLAPAIFLLLRHRHILQTENKCQLPIWISNYRQVSGIKHWLSPGYQITVYGHSWNHLEIVFVPCGRHLMLLCYVLWNNITGSYMVV